MIGFEVKINEKEISAGLNKGVVSIIFNRVLQEGRDEIDVRLVGLDLETQENLEWLAQDLGLNDLITIRVKDLNKSTEPGKRKRNEPEKLINESKLKYFHSLKKELEDKGLLEKST